jgi:hypothetical protein
MKRNITGLCVASAFALGATVSAQSGAGTEATTGSAAQRQAAGIMSGTGDVTVTGCLQRGADGNYMLMNATAETGAATASAGTTASSSTADATAPVGTSGSTPAPRAYALRGGTDLSQHVGHKVQVTGSEKSGASAGSSTTTAASGTTASSGNSSSAASTSTTPDAAAASTTAGGNGATRGSATSSLDVQSVRMIASSCS